MHQSLAPPARLYIPEAPHPQLRFLPQQGFCKPPLTLTHLYGMSFLGSRPATPPKQLCFPLAARPTSTMQPLEKIPFLPFIFSTIVNFIMPMRLFPYNLHF